MPASSTSRCVTRRMRAPGSTRTLRCLRCSASVAACAAGTVANTMLVCCSTGRSSAFRPSASRAALAWSFASRSTLCSRAYSPAAARELHSVGEISARDRLAANRVLQGEQPRAREMRIIRTDRCLDLREIKGPIGAIRDDLRMDRAQHAEPAGFVAIAVLLRADDHAFAALAVADQRGEVGLGARGKEERRLEAEALGRLRLQAVDRRIVAKDVVAKLGVHHGAAHAGTRPCNG